MNTSQIPAPPPRDGEPGRREAWIDRAVALLDESAQHLDAATLSRLNRARQAALAPQRRSRQGWFIGGGVAAAALALMIAVGLGSHVGAPPTLPADAAQDELDALTGDDSPDLYENLEFYAWLDAQQQDTNG